MTNIHDLAKFREERATEKAEFGPRRVKVTRPRNVLAVDQTLSTSGWALIEPDGKVVETGTLRTAPDPTGGHSGNLGRCTTQFLAFAALIRKTLPDVVVHEIPPVTRPGAKMSRPESSLLAAAALRNAAIMQPVEVEMIGAQAAKKRWAGKSNADKRLVHTALRILDPRLEEIKPMNEHILDAIALGWLALEGTP